jgi:toxin ParE1/3/4
MIFPVFFRKAAQREVEEAALWYEARRSGLGAAFLAEVDRSVTLISENPTRFARVYRDIQCVRLRRFPYSLFFRDDVSRAVVVAVFHARRDPAAWGERR